MITISKNQKITHKNEHRITAKYTLTSHTLTAQIHHTHQKFTMHHVFCKIDSSLQEPIVYLYNPGIKINTYCTIELHSNLGLESCFSSMQSVAGWSYVYIFKFLRIPSGVVRFDIAEIMLLLWRKRVIISYNPRETGKIIEIIMI